METSWYGATSLVTFEYKGHWVKIKVTRWKMLILLLGNYFNLALLV